VGTAAELLEAPRERHAQTWIAYALPPRGTRMIPWCKSSTGLGPTRIAYRLRWMIPCTGRQTKEVQDVKDVGGEVEVEEVKNSRTLL
jgi:hypothetical protein